MSTPIIRSRSAISTRKDCEMKAYLGYYVNRTGVSPKDFVENDGEISMASLPKVRGSLFHDLSLAIVEGATPKDIKDLVDERSKSFPTSIRIQQATLIRRAMLGWEQVRGTWWKQHYDVVSAEESWQWPISDRIVQPLRMDKILRRKSDNLLGIFDFKTMSSVDPNWPRRMENSDQTQLYVQALKEMSGEWVLGMCYDGVVVGSMKKGLQRSPFVLGFKKNGVVSATWSSGSENIDLSTYSDEKWLEWIYKQPGTLADLYCTTGFLNPPPQVLLHTKNSVARAEEEFDHRVDLVESIRETYGPESPQYQDALSLIEKNPSQCYKYGVDFACPYVFQCWHGHSLDDFEPRKDHHKQQEEED